MYAYIKNNKINEIIPDIDTVFPNVPIEERYDANFISHCEHFEDDADIQVGMERQEDGTWAFPPAPEPTPTPGDGSGDDDADITLDDLALAVAELAEQEEADKLETELAIAELAEVILNG